MKNSIEKDVVFKELKNMWGREWKERTLYSFVSVLADLVEKGYRDTLTKADEDAMISISIISKKIVEKEE